MNKKFFKRISFYLPFLAILISGCDNRKKSHTKKTPNQHQIQTNIQAGNFVKEKTRPTMTIWVHGTRALSKTVFPRFFRTIKGLHHASAYNSKNNLLQVATTLNSTDPEQFPFDNIFFFGWDGRLSPTARKRAARNLRKQLFALIEKVKEKEGVEPRIRMITHSHGGNVALHLAQLNEPGKPKLHIDELVMLACPVQKRTCDLVADNMFTNVYSMYSKIDLLQVLDPQGLYKLWSRKVKKRKPNTPLFSGRIFPKKDNVRQVKVVLNGKSIRHIDFILEKFLSQLPKMLNDLRA